jgi:hypothetical protein
MEDVRNDDVVDADIVIDNEGSVVEAADFVKAVA